MDNKVYEEYGFFPGAYERTSWPNIDALPEYYDQDAIESLISNRFKDIDFQLKYDKTAVIIFSDKYFNKPIESSNKHIHWYLVGEVLKEKYKYVAMERLDKEYNSVEEEIQKNDPLVYWAMVAFEKRKALDISNFKYTIWKSRLDYRIAYNRNLRQYFDF